MSIFQLKQQFTLNSPSPRNNVGSGKVDLQHMPPKYQHCIRARGTKFENLRSLLIFSRIVDLLIKIENFASYTELNLLPCSLPVVAIIVTCQIFLHYNTTIINNWTPPYWTNIFRWPPLFRSKIPYDPSPFFASPPTVINNECMVP